ncbi:hypothetical protein [Bradyrhizobium sp. OAE829]|uniref:hypothetical protein n=1 Tax=Bradyrhizobium sp. OAE829 TaxID=2663807 RepID=UPI001788F974
MLHLAAHVTQPDLNHSPRHLSDSAEATQMMPDQLARQEQIARRLEQAKRLVKGANDARTIERIGKMIGDLEHEQAEEKEK